MGDLVLMKEENLPSLDWKTRHIVRTNGRTRIED